MDKRYQVFVSSTFLDLQDERQEVMQALLELNCIPAGMGLFPAANEDQWTLIKKVIDDCDYYLVIIGGRYGSLGSSGVSYTEMEYRYALQQGKPIVAFLHRDPDSLPAKRTEPSPEGRERLQAFKALAQEKLVRFYSSPSDLGSLVSRSIIMLMRNHPAVGWVRADQVTSQEASVEILRLRKMVDELQIQLAKARTSAPEGAEGLAQGDDTFDVNYTFTGTKGYASYRGYRSFHASWNEIFGAVAPRMIDEASEESFRDAVDFFVTESQIEDVSNSSDWREHKLSKFRVVETDFQTIKVQLRAAGLITKSGRNRSVKDASTYWTLTPYGDSVMTRLRAIPKPEMPAPRVKQSRKRVK